MTMRASCAFHHLGLSSSFCVGCGSGSFILNNTAAQGNSIQRADSKDSEGKFHNRNGNQNIRTLEPVTLYRMWHRAGSADAVYIEKDRLSLASLRNLRLTTTVYTTNDRKCIRCACVQGFSCRLKNISGRRFAARKEEGSSRIQHGRQPTQKKRRRGNSHGANLTRSTRRRLDSRIRFGLNRQSKQSREQNNPIAFRMPQRFGAGILQTASKKTRKPPADPGSLRAGIGET